MDANNYQLFQTRVRMKKRKDIYKLTGMVKAAG